MLLVHQEPSNHDSFPSPDPAGTCAAQQGWRQGARGRATAATSSGRTIVRTGWIHLHISEPIVDWQLCLAIRPVFADFVVRLGDGHHGPPTLMSWTCSLDAHIVRA